MAFWVRDKRFYLNLIALSLPIILQNIITHAVALADNLMVGRLGETDISGLFFGNRVFVLLQMVLFGLDATVTILAAQYWGRRDVGHIKDLVAIALRLALLLTLPVTAVVVGCPRWVMGLMTHDEGVVVSGAGYLRIVGVSYLFFSVTLMLICAMRSVEMVVIGMINSLVALVVNVSGNYLLIYGNCGFPAMGVRGAAMATVVSRIVEFAVVLGFVLKWDSNLRFTLNDIKRRNALIFKDICHYGAPLMGGQLVWAFNLYLRAFVTGRLEVEAMAAMGIADMFDILLCIGVFGLASAVIVVTGKTVGRGEFEKMKTQAKTLQVIFMGLGILCGLLAYAFNGAFLRCYNLQPETMAIARSIMTVLIVVVTFRCYQAPCLMGLVKAGGDTSFVFKNDFIFVFFVIVPSVLVAQYHFHAPPWVIYACLMCDQVLKCFVAVVKINSFNWMKNLTRPQEET